MTTSLEPTTEYDYQTYPGLFCDLQDVTYAKTFIILIYCLVFIFGTFGNIVVIVIMRSKKKSNRLADVFITHLAIADLVFLLTLPFWVASIALDYHWPFGQSLCKICSYILVVNMYSSIFFLTCMGIDRYLAIVLALNYSYLRNRRYAIVTSLVIWLLSMILGLPTLLSRHLLEYDDKWICSEENTLSKNVFTLVIRFISFVLPLAIITVCYCSVGFKLYRHFDRRTKEQRKKRKSIKIGFWIIAMFVLSWLPYNVLKTLDVFVQILTINVSCDTHEAMSKGLKVSTCLAFFNSCVNPIVYLVFDCYFRESFMQLLPFQSARKPRSHSSTSMADSTKSQRHNASLKEPFNLSKISS
ncbi:apelin receptor A-like [Chiloscyllium plagiosum]|uniref:apelin receptor A-like n=1 Tax=Chiloscyllium plagiosum TaxID=36176 RepID=UPI001CB80B4E|nr:apelin receptor A-like [Chiloscyllium plagiosum]